MATNNRLAPLAPKEVRWIRGAFWSMGIIGALMAAVLAIAGVVNNDDSPTWWWAMLAGMWIIVFTYLFHRLFLLPWDYRAGHKLVADTEVIRVSKFGFFDTDASDGGYSSMMLGSLYYLYVKDPARKSGQRKFRVKMELYTALHPGDQVTIGYLPRCGMLLSLDCGSYHYEPVRKRAA